jgi:hypothetical protein
MKREKTGGRQIGSSNKITRPLKELISDVLSNDLNDILVNGHAMSSSEREARVRCIYMLGKLIIKPTPDLGQSTQPIFYITQDVYDNI